ncbi:LTA synthase family protein [Falsibacillus albus]|uniref:LTA synthase family protein n=1 Tax=Falsibacillus albus TaxID=2478915 RepID=A0A3L7K6M6_9BACI|nr:LTA synthase family protein [Falsibacillus albus]RLQ98235.1 LTA synthase family protein [Falsibacillus albus]
MKFLKKTDISIVLLAAGFLWLKSYIVYKTSFHIKIENGLQEFILLINPLSFLLLIFGVAFFIKSEKIRNRYVLTASFILSFVLYANVAFYRFFDDFLTLPVLFQTNNFGDLGNSAGEIIHWGDILFFADTFVLTILMRRKPGFLQLDFFSIISRRGFVLFSISLILLNLGLAEVERPQLLTRTFDREMLVKNIGTFNYHLYDIFLQSKSSAQRAMADGSELVGINNYVRANYQEPNEKYFGIAKGKNVIIVSLESLQSFVINHKVNGKEATPYLNKFIHDSFYFDHFYHQTGQGKTSDAEFLVENSLFPLGRGAVFFTHSGNVYHSMAERLNENGYYTAGMHANNKSFWNRDIMYKSLSYNRFYSMTDYSIRDEDVIGWGLKDIPFFNQSVGLMKQMPTPFYTKLITLTNHHPFKLDEQDKLIDEFTSGDGTFNRYFTTVRYTDEAIKQFIEGLKEQGLYRNSIIVLYGDHYGISENHNEAMKQYLGKEITPLANTELQKVPLFIHIPGVTDKGRGKVISEVGGQVDIRPTVLHLLGISTKGDIQFGTDLFSNNHGDFAVLRNGSFVSKEYIYTKNVCYSKITEQPVQKENCQPYNKKAKQELDYSDKIIYGDLLRFYDQKNAALKGE